MPSIHLDLGLPAFGVFATYFARIFVAYLLCEALSKLCFRPRLRFLIWISFVFSAGACWAGLVAKHAFGGTVPEGAVETAGHSLLTPSLGLPRWDLPIAWSVGLGEAGRILGWGYAAGVTFFLVRMLLKRIQLRLVLRHAVPVSAELQSTFNNLRCRTRAHYCELLSLPGITSPATAYAWGARILLPEFIESYLNKPQLEDILCHEFMHVKRRDFFWGTLNELVQCVVWFHPAIWLASGHLRQERELACDAAVVENRHLRIPDYAECLTRLTRVRLAAERKPSTLIQFSRSGSFLGQRVRALLAERKRPSWLRLVAAWVTGAVIVMGFAMVWPGLAIVLQFTPPAVTDVLQKGVPARNHRRTVRHHHSVHNSRRGVVTGHPSIPTSPRMNPVPAQPATSASLSPSAPVVAHRSFRPVTDLVEGTSVPDSSRTVAAPAPGSAVWTESLPQTPSTDPPSWRTLAVRVAATTLSRGGVIGGGEGPDSGQNQQGNHYLNFPPHP